MIALFQSLRTGFILLIIYTLVYFIGEVLFVMGLFKLSNNAKLIVDPYPVAQPQAAMYPQAYVVQPQPAQPQMTQHSVYIQKPGEQPQALFNQQGQEQEEKKTMFCSNCGKKVAKDAKFCENCGYKLIE